MPGCCLPTYRGPPSSRSKPGEKIISDSLTRFVFILFLLLSIPTGFHHQYTDPGISTTMKAIHAVLTFGVFFPSLATAFSVMASLEMGARAHGGKGLLGWIPKLPWGDPSLAAQLLAMITFVFGGITGLINASFTMNKVCTIRRGSRATFT